MHIRVLILWVFTMLVGCQSYDPERVEDDFGESVRTMIAEQLYSPAATNPSSAGPDRLDGPTAVRTIEEYQKSARQNKSGVASAGSGVQ